MNVAVGIVFHGAEGRRPIEPTPGLDVLVRVNARIAGAPTPWRGFGANHNELIAEAAGADWYVALNPDVEISAAEVMAMIAMAEDAGFAAVGPSLLYAWGSGEGIRGALPTPGALARVAVLSARSGRAPSAPRRLVPAAWISGACLAVRMDARPRFDERYFMYYEDVDLCMRLTRAGHRIGVCSAVTASHATGWSPLDPLRWRRGVEFARSAERFAEASGHNVASMRAAGLLLYGSRTLLRGRTPAQAVASRSIARGFALPRRAAGLAELAAAHNARHGF